MSRGRGESPWNDRRSSETHHEPFSPSELSTCGLEPVNEEPEVSKHEIGWRYVVRNFTPAWFSANMGTGIVSILLNTLPYNGRWLYWISVVIFVLNILLFLVFLICSLLRYIVYPDIFSVMVRHPVQSLFLGTFPMGLATIINMICLVCVPAWGSWVAYVAWGLWIADAVISVMTCFALPFIMWVKNESTLPSMGPAWLLPIVACVVAAASGGIVASVLPNPQHALGTLLASYVLWGVGVPLAMMIIGIYLMRLMLHKLPARAIIVSTFLPLGPLGQGGFGIQKLGDVAQKVFPQTQTLRAGAGDVLHDVGVLLGLLLWGFGLLWLFFAVASILYVRRFPFKLGWWAFTFPLGVFSTCTVQLGRELPSRFYAVLGTILSLCVVLLWILVTCLTINGILDRTLFVASDLAALQDKRRRMSRQEETKLALHERKAAIPGQRHPE
ncbi:TDT family transporter [Aspergillus clavatus NRRL 1]|uniref:Sulfite efflux pump SSU1 n=1 Tax=Aspergillus clavatus (strain ATCC 1007 / CBS 513.65 / DSM 816 / NCTC 3887 / NRRL 1 / QM 1276 / 107) TaxID=344612 RepID=A1CC16_ASPCL|nr:C4-dicarboxylate/malic acid transporter, putative [Aspergillus clavatus NRRL 1]EAW13284.1 C4-dicarboxylate/malic acid transporter, putative [Aspergillus clavatus NRRL 1]